MFRDIGHLSKEAQDAVLYCARHGLIRGTLDNQFSPDVPIPRWQQAILTKRLHERTREFPDAIADQVRPAVVMVVDEATGQLGSGVSIGGGYIVTNAHVVLREDGTHAMMLGIHWDANEPSYAMGPVVGIRQDKDLAIIRADIGEGRLILPRLPLATEPIGMGEPLTALGAPVGLIGSMSHGIVSYLNRGLSYSVGGVRTKFAQSMQTDAAINPGNSGGAAVNRRGELVGIPSAKLVGLALEGLGFVIGIHDVRELLEELKLDYIPYFDRPNYEGSPEGYSVSVKTHYMDTRNVTSIVVHHTGDAAGDRDTSAEEIHRHHRLVNGWAGIGYHFVIRKDGRIQIGRSIYTQGAHAGAAINPRSWGVVFSGNFDLAKPTGLQLASWHWLRRYLNEVRPGLVVTGHRDHGQTSCPGKHLTLADLA